MGSFEGTYCSVERIHSSFDGIQGSWREYRALLIEYKDIFDGMLGWCVAGAFHKERSSTIHHKSPTFFTECWAFVMEYKALLLEHILWRLLRCGCFPQGKHP